jgi:hypothetical protein
VASRSCPLCQREYPSGFVRCACGYGFETGDVGLAVARLSDMHTRMKRIRNTGLLLVLALPVLVALGYAAGVGELAVVVASLQAGIGGGQLIVGSVHARRTRRQLRAIDVMRRLPTARLLT